MIEDYEQTTQRLWAALGWEKAPTRAEEALTHPSYANEQRRRNGPPLRPSSSAATAEPVTRCTDNQRLEFLGDAVLGLCVSEMLMETFPDADEGELSRMRAALVRAESLATFARKIQLGDALRLGRGADAAGDRSQTNVLADAVEALVAAAYLEGGLEQARFLVEKIIGDGLTHAAELAGRDPKSELQERVQREGKPAPTYRMSASGGPDHERWFDVEVLIAENVVAQGRGRSKKLAEQTAAQRALSQLFPPQDGEKLTP